eukprot:14665386-Alexandrium_andersonii.AAC.1
MQKREAAPPLGAACPHVSVQHVPQDCAAAPSVLWTALRKGRVFTRCGRLVHLAHSATFPPWALTGIRSRRRAVRHPGLGLRAPHVQLLSLIHI